MTLRVFPSLLTVSLLALLSACGGTDLPSDAGQGTASASLTTALAAAPTAGVQPLPDCHPEECAGLRIIDGNAEAWRIDAMRRAQQDS